MAYPRFRKPVSAARLVCGGQPVAMTIASMVAPSGPLSILTTSSILVPCALYPNERLRLEVEDPIVEQPAMRTPWVVL